MKRCPTCGLNLDDSQTFCTNDGTPLVSEKGYDPQATMIIPPGSVPTAPAPEPQRPQPPQTGWQTPARPTTPPIYGAQQQQQPPPQQQYQPGSMPMNQPAGARAGKFVPGLIGGAVAGFVSMLAGFLSPDVFIILSFFCVVWAVIGGALAAKLYVNRSPNPVRSGEGAVVGLIAGAIAGLIYLAIDTPIAYAIHGDYIEMVAHQQPEKISAGAFFALSGMAGAVTILGFSILGGLIGVAMFEKRKGGYNAGMPPPPPGYGTPPGGYR